MDGLRLQVFERVDHKEQLPTPFNLRYLGKYWDKKGLHKDEP